jgi:ATP-dependent Clp protease protease subunit
VRERKKRREMVTMEVIGRAAELCVPRRAHLWSSSTPSSSSSSSTTTTTTPQVSSSAFFASSVYVRKAQKTPLKTLKHNSRSSSSSSITAKSIPESDFLCPILRSSCQSSIAGNGMSSAWSTLHQSYHNGHRGIVTMVIPFQRGDATQQPPPDLPSYLFKNRIVFLGMSLVPSVTELIMAELLYLQYEDPEKPIYMYINSTGTTKDGEKLGYETEAFAIYDTMRYVKPPIFTLCVGNAWGEAALLLAAGSKGNRATLPSATIMIKQPIAQFRGQATDLDIARKEVRNVKAELVGLYARHTGHSPEKIEEDIRRPKYFSPEEAVEYGIIDKVLYSDKGDERKGVVADLRKAQLI